MSLLIRPHLEIASLPPYMGEPNAEIISLKQVGLEHNENPLGPSSKAVEAIQRLIPEIHRYPDIETVALREALAEQNGLNVDQIITGNGSEEILRLLVQSFVYPGDEVIFGQYSFPLYEMLTVAAHGIPVKAPVRNLKLTVDDILYQISPRTRVVFLDNPSNPVGHMLPKAEIHRLHRSLPQDVLFILDGAYAEYVEDPTYTDGRELVDIYDNVVVTHTFSKFYGLAGLRLGWAYGSRKVIDFIKRTRLSFCCNTLAQAAALATLQDNDYKFQVLKHHHQIAPWFQEELEKRRISFVPSCTNFVLVDLGSPERAESVQQNLLHIHGILVRRPYALGLKQHVRISYGVRSDMERVLEILSS